MGNIQNLNFDDGFKRFTINGDPNKVIMINPSDFGIIERINDAYKMIEDASKLTDDVELKADGSPVEELGKAAEVVKGFRETINKAINYIFDSDITSVAFGNQSPLSLVGGVPLYQRFMNVVIPVIKKEIESEMQASQKRISKYTSQVK
jgi:uncharacterized protein YjbJ (UPF0337 family)